MTIPKTLTKLYVGVLLLLATGSVLAVVLGTSTRLVTITGLVLFGILDFWYVFRIWKLRQSEGAAINWLREMLLIVVCLAIIAYVVLRRLP